jgi:SAM-dependent methyltransferase
MQLSHGGAIVISFWVHIRRAGIADESVDLVISNCVVNLSPDKQRVIREAYRVLRPGGEMHFSDVYADRRVPAALQTDEVSGCCPACCTLQHSGEV